MKRKKRKKSRPSPSYVLLPGVTHPQGRAQAFTDAMKAMVRGFIEVNKNPTVAYAIDKTDRIVIAENQELMTKEDIAEWKAACDEFQEMLESEKKAWIDNVLSTYPRVDELPDPGGYNQIH